MKSIDQLHKQLKRHWDQYRVHQDWMNDGDFFPLHLSLGKITDKQLLHDYDTVRRWIAEVEKRFSKHSSVDITYQDVQFKTMGRQRLPDTLSVHSADGLASYLGCLQSWRSFKQQVLLIQAQQPNLNQWVSDHPNLVDQYITVWPQLIKVIHWFLSNLQPGCYIRQLPIAGVDTKFIYQHRGILKQLLDQLLPDSAICQEIDGLQAHGFERRFSLLYEEPQVRFRLLDPMLASEFSGLDDLTVNLSAFETLDLLVDRVFITENKVNGLAFPSLKNSLVIFGFGYGIQMLKSVQWLSSCQIHYWGDIDTHGFKILSQIRNYFPQARSFLMDEPTLLASRHFWGVESSPATESELANLAPEEQALYQGLKQNQWACTLRLEQERIPFDHVQDSLKRFR